MPTERVPELILSHKTSNSEIECPPRWTLSRLVLIAVIVVSLAIPILPIAIDVYNSHRERKRLIHETDHQALLEASRQLMKDFAGQQIDDPSTDPRVPAIIRRLGPSYMTISDEQLRVELHGGFDHYGFIAFADGINTGNGWGKLTDGLFYYTE